MAVYTGLSRWYLHTLKIVRWIYRLLKTISWLLLPLLGSTEVEKCRFFTNFIDFLGHVMSPGLLPAGSHTIEDIRRLHTLLNFTKLASFLGEMASDRAYGTLEKRAVPRNQILRKDQLHVFAKLSDYALETLNALKQKLISPPVLALPQLQGSVTYATTGGNLQKGCVLSKRQHERQEKLIGYWLRALVNADRVYGPIFLDGFAVVSARLLLHHNLNARALQLEWITMFSRKYWT